MITVEDLVDLMVEPGLFKLEVYDVELGETVFVGMADEVPDEYLYRDIASLDSPIHSMLCVNI